MASKLTIEKLADDGRGLVRVDGKVAFVSGALPGEIVSARRTRRTAGFDEYELLAVETPAPSRVAPPCPIYDRCGGCDFQHLDHAAQMAHKSRVLLGQLERATRQTPAFIDAPIMSAPFGYRRRARLAVDARNRKSVRVGFRREGSADVVDIDQCGVLEPTLAEIPGALRALISRLDAPRRVGHIELQSAELNDETYPVLGVHIVGDLGAPDRASWCSFAAEHRAYLRFTAESENMFAVMPHATPPGYVLPAFGVRLAFEPGDFVQGNAEVNRTLVARTVEWLDAKGGERVLDAFCGLGNFALPIATRGAHVVGVESRATTVALARRNAADNRLTNCEFMVRDLHQSPMPIANKPTFDAVVLDPPRSGALELVRWIAQRKIARVLYVSCSPATLARDARVFVDAGYRLERSAIVDMFPQTSHIESMCLFTR